MRSGLIFRASDQISNRFLLCRMISTSARKMHRDGVSMSQSINRSLLALENATQPVAQDAAPTAEPEPAIVGEG
jgi:hypothetical protein